MATIPLNVGGGGSSLETTGSVTTPIYIDADGNAQVCTALDQTHSTPAAEGHVEIFLVGSTSSSAQWEDLSKVSTVKISTNDVLIGAGWNDFAETREVKEIGGTCVIENGDGTMSKSTKRLQKGGAIVSDTYGMLIGPEGVKYTPIAVAGRVLARVASWDLNKFKVGDAVCTGENGTISRMNRLEIILFPDRIIGYVSEFPKYKTWNKVKTANRIWITVR